MDNERYPVKIEETPEPPREQHQHEREETRDFKPLKTLPAPLELLLIATRYVNAAHRISSILAAGHTLTGEECAEHDVKMQDDATDGATATRTTGSVYADFVSTYRRYMQGAIISCEHAVRIGGPDVRQNLRARLMLAEILARETHNTEYTEQVISKALALASTHESLADYRLHFLYLQIELSLSNGNVKFAKTLTKKTAVEVHRDHPGQIAWLYRFQLLFIRICESYERDYPSSMAALGDMVQQSHARGHRQLSWTLLTMRARLAVLRGDSELASSIISELAKDLSLPVTDSDVSDVDVKLKSHDIMHSDPELQALPLPLTLQFVILLCVHQTHAGHTNAARQNIRRAQILLDQKKLSDEHVDGSVTLELHHTNRIDGQCQSLTLQTLPKSVFYAYTYLISTIVQLDPIGRQPKCLHFAAAGHERLIELLDFGWDFRASDAVEDSRYAEGPIERIEGYVKRLAGIRIDLMLVQGDLLLMRSSLDDVHLLIADLVNLSRSYDLWETYKARIVMLQAMFTAFLGELDTAFEYFAKVLEWIDGRSHLGIVARTSLLLIRLAQGFRVRLTASEGHTSSPTPKKRLLTDPLERASPAPSEEASFQSDEDLEGFAKGILQDCNNHTPSLKILGLIVEALVNGEISRAKRNLSLALQLSSDVGNQHIKPIILALLACQFSNTRNDQAFKMLHSAHAICASMGGADKNKDKHKVKQEQGERLVDNAGLAKLGLWMGDQLLETYKREDMASKAARQQECNERYNRALIAQRRLSRRAL